MGSILEDNQRPLVIHMWGAPRSLSTCTMYSFSRRPDTKVLDEPLFGYRFYKSPVSRSYREETMRTKGIDASAILNGMINYKGKSIVFAKHVSHEYPIGFGDDEQLKPLLFNGTKSKHVILIREPLELIAGYKNRFSVHGQEPSMDTLGYPKLAQLWTDAELNTGRPPIVLDSDLLKTEPKIMLQKFCETLGIDFYEEQLSWPPGPKPDIDGCWAEYWYDTVYKSTGFSTWTSSETRPSVMVSLSDFTPSEIELYYKALPLYEKFKKHAIQL